MKRSLFDRFIKTKADQAMVDVIGIVATIFSAGFGLGALLVWWL